MQEFAKRPISYKSSKPVSKSEPKVNSMKWIITSENVNDGFLDSIRVQGFGTDSWTTHISQYSGI